MAQLLLGKTGAVVASAVCAAFLMAGCSPTANTGDGYSSSNYDAGTTQIDPARRLVGNGMGGGR